MVLWDLLLNDLRENNLEGETEAALFQVLLEHQGLLLALTGLLLRCRVFDGLRLGHGRTDLNVSLRRVRVDFVHFRKFTGVINLKLLIGRASGRMQAKKSSWAAAVVGASGIRRNYKKKNYR